MKDRNAVKQSPASGIDAGVVRSVAAGIAAEGAAVAALPAGLVGQVLVSVDDVVGWMFENAEWPSEVWTLGGRGSALVYSAGGVDYLASPGNGAWFQDGSTVGSIYRTVLKFGHVWVGF